MQRLEEFTREAVRLGKSLHEVEQKTLGAVLLMGKLNVDQFLQAQGNGDLGETVTTTAGRTLRRSPEAINAHQNHHLPAMLAGGARLGVKHQGHLVKEDVRLGNLWCTVFDRMQVPLPKNFQGGESDGIVPELV